MEDIPAEMTTNKQLTCLDHAELSISGTEVDSKKVGPCVLEALLNVVAMVMMWMRSDGAGTSVLQDRSSLSTQEKDHILISQSHFLTVGVAIGSGGRGHLDGGEADVGGAVQVAGLALWTKTSSTSQLTAEEDEKKMRCYNQKMRGDVKP